MLSSSFIERTLLLLIGLAVSPLSRAADAEPIDFNRDVRPLLSRCLACHGPDAGHRVSRMRLDVRESATKPLTGGGVVISPGAPEKSELIRRVTAADELDRMPPTEAGHPLTPPQIEVLRRWIKEGATYAEHWAFVKPQATPTPKVQQSDWPRSSLDYFVLAKLEKAGLRPAPVADPYVLLRRVSLDLRGLPPTPKEIAQFADDRESGAFERAVDRFLTDPAFGERWARPWLDLARYADSAGYGSDPLRPNMWRYRDWVIEAFNRNLPYDQFTIDQLAGDLLPNATLEQKVATAFNRNTMTNTEGGTDDEEFRVAAVKDRVDTTFQVWMGLTMGCAKCHSHKYDPLTIKDYYQVFAIFNQTADRDQPNESPTMPAPTAAQQEQLRLAEARAAELRKVLETQSPELAAAQAKWEKEFSADPAWTPLRPTRVASASGASLTVGANGDIRAGGTNPKTDTYTVTGRIDRRLLGAIRLEALPDPESPSGGAGRSSEGNFVLTHITAEVVPAGTDTSPPKGRFVRIELPGMGKMLSLAEVQVFNGNRNLALKAAVRQSSTDYEGAAARAVDGNTDGKYASNSVTHTRAEKDPWWEVELPGLESVERIVVWNRTDGGVGNRLKDFRVLLLDESRWTVWKQEVAEVPSPSRSLEVTGRQPLHFAKAFADYSQEGFPIEGSLDSKPSGWAVGPKQKAPHEAVFVTQRLLDGTQSPSEGLVDLTVRLEHNSKQSSHTLGRFRLSVSNDPLVVRHAKLPADARAALAIPAAGRTPAQQESISRAFRAVTPLLDKARAELDTVLKSQKQNVVSVPIMQELPPAQRRKSHVLIKGNFLDPGDPVAPALPSAFHALPGGSTPDRLGVARWLTHPDNPLTARVAVNRVWAQIFGTGIVETEEDFGTQGEFPSHPELLDWLALEYQRLGWDTKALIKLLVTSATYRQSSAVTPEKVRLDPRNRLLSRGPRFRLEAEMVRDQALALSGLLVRKVGGPSVFPPQPDGLWQAAFNGQRTWATSKGEDRYRRGLYTFWRRTVPYPSMATFDAPSREICAIRRTRTNTPLQAFVTLNDPVFVEAAQALARRIVREGGAGIEERVRFGLTLCLARPTRPEQVAIVVGLVEEQLDHFRKDPQSAVALATDPLGPLPEGMKAEELAAWTVVANVLLNMDGVLTKN